MVNKAINTGKFDGENHRSAINTNEITGTDLMITIIGWKNDFQKTECVAITPKTNARIKEIEKPIIPLKIVADKTSINSVLLKRKRILIQNITG